LGVNPRGHLSGEAISSYIDKYVEKFDLRSRIKLNTKVLRATNNELDVTKQWTLETEYADSSAGSGYNLVTCSKLVIATGLASQLYLPSFPGLEAFEKPIIHTIDLGKTNKSLISSKSVAHVTVIGGSKSAHDAVYLFATARKQVTWLIRASGRGAMPMAKLLVPMGPCVVWLEGLLMTRPLTWLGAAPWSTEDGFGLIRWALHGTSLGRKLVQGYFSQTSETRLRNLKS
jgi:cation diffusion facilitator CzcD-associated flavoprotein CzcO